MNQIILSEYQELARAGQVILEPSDSGRTIIYAKLSAGKIVAEGGLCNDPDCDCQGQWEHWKES